MGSRRGQFFCLLDFFSERPHPEGVEALPALLGPGEGLLGSAGGLKLAPTEGDLRLLVGGLLLQVAEADLFAKWRGGLVEDLQTPPPLGALCVSFQASCFITLELLEAQLGAMEAVGQFYLGPLFSLQFRLVAAVEMTGATAPQLFVLLFGGTDLPLEAGGACQTPWAVWLRRAGLLCRGAMATGRPGGLEVAPLPPVGALAAGLSLGGLGGEEGENGCEYYRNDFFHF